MTDETPTSTAPAVFAGLFAGKVALLTASTSGIGLATAQMLAAAGARAVVINGRNVAAGEAAAASIRARAPDTQVELAAGDVSVLDEARRVCETTLARHGRVDVFVHAAGGDISPRPFIELDPAVYRPLIDGHFTSLLNCCSVIAPAMAGQQGGSIIAIASDAGKIATPGESIIGAMTAAVMMYVRTLALELGRHGVRVNCITPSLVTDTKAHDRVMSSEFSRKIFEKASRRARLGVPSPADIAPLAVFLASPLASHLTGQAISVNGGISAA